MSKANSGTMELKTHKMVQEISGEILRMLELDGDNSVEELRRERLENERIAAEAAEVEHQNKTEDFRQLQEEDILSVLSFVSDQVQREKEEEEKEASSKRPTPFDIWKRANGTGRMEKEKRKLSQNEFNSLAARLHEHQVKKELARKKAQDQALVEELANLNFKPQINKFSKNMVQVKPIHERLDDIIRRREEKIEKERRRQQEEEVAECRDSPQINRSRRWRPRVERKYLDARKEDARLENLDCTFSPMVNTKSIRMAETATTQGRRLTVEESATITKQKKVEQGPLPSFRPKINSKSRSLHREQPAHERLYKLSQPQAIMAKSGLSKVPKRSSQVDSSICGESDSNVVKVSENEHEAFLASLAQFKKS